MKLKALYNTVEEVPEALREYYVEKDEKFVLDAEGVEDVSGLKSALSKEREARKVADARVKAYIDAVGEDPSKVQADLSRLAELQAFDPSKEADKIASEKMKAREASLIATHARELAKAKEEGTLVSKQLQNVLIDNAAIAAISEAKGSSKLLLPIVNKFTRMRLNESGKYIAEVLDEAGNPRIADGHGTPMTIAQFVAELKSSDEFGRAFDAEGRGGSGGPSGGPPAPAPGSTKKVSIRDQDGMNANIADIATGKVVVTE